MFYYIDQPRTPILSYWVNKNWIWIIRSVETDFGRWTLVVAIINVDTYHFLVFSDLQMFYGWTVLPDSKDTELGISDQESSP